METVTVPILESDLQKLEEITAAINSQLAKEGRREIAELYGSAWSALNEGIDRLHKAWVTK